MAQPVTKLDIVRDSPFGQVVRLITKNKVFPYPDELPDFVCPSTYLEHPGHKDHEHSEKHDAPIPEDAIEEPTEAEIEAEKIGESSSENDTDGIGPDLERHQTLSEMGLARTKTLPYTEDRLEVEKRITLDKTKSRIIAPQKTSDGVILVDWFTTDDPENPQNWSQKKKAFVAFEIK
jgi:MFS transporter, DHA1 family, multidrug resistance protein